MTSNILTISTVLKQFQTNVWPTQCPPHPSSSTDEPALFLWKGSEAPPTLRAPPPHHLPWASASHLDVFSPPRCPEGPHCLDFSETLVSSRLSSRPASNSLISPAKAQEAGSCLAMKTEVRQTMEEETEYGK